jgi:hypothetical protein
MLKVEIHLIVEDEICNENRISVRKMLPSPINGKNITGTCHILFLKKEHEKI